MFPEEFNERCSRSLQHDILLQIHELPHGPNLSPACTEFGPNFGMLFYTLAFRTESLCLSFYFPRERLPCCPFRDQSLKSPIFFIPLGERPPISSSKSVFPKQSQYCPKGSSQSIVGSVKWVKCNVYCA